MTTSAEEKAIRITWLSIAGNTVLTIVKGIGGVAGNSYALTADAIESTSDIFSSILVLFGLRYASKPPDKDHPYGHGRAEPLITFLVVGFLVAAATVIAYEGIQHIRVPHELPKPFTLIILGIVVVVKETFYRVVMARGKEANSSAVKADAWHHRSDAITSLTAFVGISFALIMGAGYESADDWAALVAAAIIYYNSYRIFRPALGEIMDENLYEDLIVKIRVVALTVPGIRGTEKCLVRKTGMHFHVDLHAVVDGDITVQEGHSLAHQLKNTLMKELPEVGEVMIHIEPQGEVQV